MLGHRKVRRAAAAALTASVLLATAGAAEAQRAFDALGKGGQVQMPVTKTFFSPAFGMLADRFGVSWMVVAEH